MSTEPHHRVGGWQKTVDRLLEIDCVAAISYDRTHAGAGGPKPRVFSGPPGGGVLYVVLGQGADTLPLRVQTTATTDDQVGLVRTWIERNIGKW